ncbi:hypothetical protein [Paenibacillus psychroresistens]|uniref:hypothetical protein n=1 Tax=Paenibacillus psychroresistens TaxID=1778678 RepID=UPI0012DA3780|nr:hypothetical protein [Paenibacillus psychroresistens]
MKQVCLDANIWIKILTVEPDSEQVQNLVVQLFKRKNADYCTFNYENGSGQYLFM